MKYKLLLFILLINSFSIIAQAPNWVWAVKAGGSEDDLSRSMAMDANENIYITGEFEYYSTFGNVTLTSAGARDIFIAKYDASGNVLWAKRAGGNSNDEGTDIAADGAGNIYITGRFYSSSVSFGSIILSKQSQWDFDLFVAKYDANGNVLWAKNLGLSIDALSTSPCSIAIDGQDNVYVSGSFQNVTVMFGSDTLQNNRTDGEIFLLKYDSNGNEIWARQAKGNSLNCNMGLTTDANGNIFITGYFYSSIVYFESIALSNSGGAYTVDIFLVKYDNNGNVLWAKSAGGSDTDKSFSITTDGSGNAYVTGGFMSPSITFDNITLIRSGAGDHFLVKYDSNGNVLWAKRAGGNNSNSSAGGTSMVIGRNGNIYIAGVFGYSVAFESTTLNSSGDADVFVVNYDVNGNVLWAKKAGGTQRDWCTGIAVDASADIYVSGYFWSTPLYFGNIPLSSSGSHDIFVAKLNGSSANAVQRQNEETGFLNIYPNPSGDIFTVGYSGTSANNVTLIIRNATGQVIFSKRFPVQKEIKEKVDLSAQSKGIYFVEVSEGSIRKTKKVVLK